MKYKITVTQEYDTDNSTMADAVYDFIKDMEDGNFELSVKPIIEEKE